MMGEEVMSSFKQTCGVLDLPLNEEPNTGSMRGLTVFPKTIEQADNFKEDAGRAYYWLVSKRPNLDSYLESFVENMIWHPEWKNGDIGRTTSNVIFVGANGMRSTIIANREVILSAGSLRSPLLLERSVVGNPSTNFTSLGGYAAYFNVEGAFGQDLAAFNASIASSLKHYTERTANVSGVIDSVVTEKLFRMQCDLIFKNKIPISDFIVSPAGTSPITIEYWGLLPFSCGSIHINSSNASAPANINPNYFMLDYDMY
ncbi:hypothetical protein G6011_09524 [Alternaria panax]|uniref:Glucose-methanol-choline oxidoreductase N-terminal domain-containing protein n=1 Tax=Alternaria panax TaxID=48097 RepID=A0AAD4NMR9_9PLEO|nr:hypothetical protein G6011_09524 [Alternaria panax]